jgi:DinB superfamily
MFKHQIPACPEYYKTYINAVSGDENLLEVLNRNQELTQKVLFNLTEAQAGFRYAPEKWSVKEILVHLIDTERIMSYRALRFARQDYQELAGFEQNDYVKSSQADRRKIADIAREFAMVRRATIELFRSFDEEAMLRKGIASHNELYVVTLGFVIAGHENHHMRIIKEKYLSSE